MTILFVASEVAPFSKTGGLADVVAALPRALAQRGHHVTVVTPRYRGIALSGAPTQQSTVTSGSESHVVVVHELVAWPPERSQHSEAGGAAPLDPRSGRLERRREAEGGGGGGSFRLAFVDAPALFDREGLYGEAGGDYPDNPRRFTVLARAALEYARRRGAPIDVLHAHDWQAGLAPVLLRIEHASDPVLGSAASVCTIHNLAYQGLCEPGWLQALGLPPSLFATDALEFWGRVSFLKGGILFSDAVTTVSPRYAREVQTPGFGCGFDGILRSRGDAFTGILNGIDEETWDPRTDALLPAPIAPPHFSGKRACKEALLARFGLPVAAAALRRPLVGMISRLVEQKGHGLIEPLADDLPRLDASFVVMGEGEARFEGVWRDLAARHPDRFAVHAGYDEPRAHLVQGGADIFLLPSRFEPCGLGQLYAQRYGTVPVVHAVGGLDDTVDEFDAAAGVGTGFKFAQHDPGALLACLARALATFRDRAAWRRLQRNGARRDFSWDRSAAAYVGVYRQAVARHRDVPQQSQEHGGSRNPAEAGSHG